MARIFQLNGVDIFQPHGYDVQRSGVYKTLSRLNHSCCPNVVWSGVREDWARLEVRVCHQVCDHSNKLLHCNSGFTAHVVTTTRVSLGREERGAGGLLHRPGRRDVDGEGGEGREHPHAVEVRLRLPSLLPVYM